MVGLLNAAVTLLFVFGYFTHAPWRVWLGSVTLTASLSVLMVFTYGTIASGAWEGNVFSYLWLYVPILPVVILFISFNLFAARMRVPPPAQPHPAAIHGPWDGS